MLDRKNVDIAAFIAGEARGSVKMILHHIRHLPEDATYTAIMAAKADDGDVELPELDPALVAQMEAKTWNFDRKLLAQVINAVNLNTRVSGSWEEGKAPNFPTVGPASWRDEQAQPKPEEQSVSVLDVMKAWGYDGGL